MYGAAFFMPSHGHFVSGQMKKESRFLAETAKLFNNALIHPTALLLQ
jgi:hypothetical protein